MTDTFALTARPYTTAIAWATVDAIFVEIPCKDGPPFICRYHKTVEGLAQALNVLVENNEPITRNIQRDHPKISHGPVTSFTESQRAHAQAVLKRLKIT